MTPALTRALELPTRRAAATFAAKVALFRLRRTLQNLAAGPPHLATLPLPSNPGTAGHSRTPLWSDLRTAERAHQLGKVHNLRRAARALHGTVIPDGATFSFWRQVGPATRARGYVDGRMLQQGCMVPATGGGLCQLSNALYDVALQAGCTILERHAHSRIVPGSVAAHGRDATVAWNYVDLRFRPGRTLHLAVELERDDLVVRLLGAPEPASSPEPATPTLTLSAHTCATCDETACFRHEHPAPLAGTSLALMDETWPEFRAHLAATQPGARTIPATTALLPALRRSLAIRAAAPGPATRRAESTGTARIARALARTLEPGATDLHIAQSFLPTLWHDGHLGGRHFTVLMTRLPMHLIHARLDAAFAAHPGRATLADHRAAPDLVAWEAEALARADAIVTPHPDIAAAFPGRATLLDWHAPTIPRIPRTPSRRIAFPGPTLARKGAYELRDAARILDLEILLLGPDLEGPGFWDGIRTLRPGPAAPPTAWLQNLAAVVQPALAEQRPRHLLAARAAGIPVIATPACGLPASPGVTLIPPLDPAALIQALRTLIDAPAPVCPPPLAHAMM